MALTVIVILLDAAVEAVTHGRLEVIVQVTESPVASVLLVNIVVVAARLPFTYH